MSFLVLDTETTGKYPSTAECLSVAIIDAAGTVLLDTLVRPVRNTSWPEAQRIHGITPAHVLRDDVPTLELLTPRIAGLIAGQQVVIYNAGYDAEILRDAFALAPPAHVQCAMLAFAEHYGDWNDYFGNYRWQSLATAAHHVGHQWRGAAHGALADCYAARDVWAYLTDRNERERLTQQKEELALEAAANQYIMWWEQRLLAAKSKECDERNWAWERKHLPAMGINIFGGLNAAEGSADAFCRHQTGYPLAVWNRYHKLLKLKRYGQPRMPKQPKHYVAHDEVYLLRPVAPVAMRQLHADFPHALYRNSLLPLYSLRKMVLGLDYVPYTHDFPEGHYSVTALQRDLKLTKGEIARLRPALRKVSARYDDYLLYKYPPAHAD